MTFYNTYKSNINALQNLTFENGEMWLNPNFSGDFCNFLTKPKNVTGCGHSEAYTCRHLGFMLKQTESISVGNKIKPEFIVMLTRNLNESIRNLSRNWYVTSKDNSKVKILNPLPYQATQIYVDDIVKANKLNEKVRRCTSGCFHFEVKCEDLEEFTTILKNETIETYKPAINLLLCAKNDPDWLESTLRLDGIVKKIAGYFYLALVADKTYEIRNEEPIVFGYKASKRLLIYPKLIKFENGLSYIDYSDIMITGKNKAIRTKKAKKIILWITSYIKNVTEDWALRRSFRTGSIISVYKKFNKLEKEDEEKYKEILKIILDCYNIKCFSISLHNSFGHNSNGNISADYKLNNHMEILNALQSEALRAHELPHKSVLMHNTDELLPELIHKIFMDIIALITQTKEVIY